MRRTVEDFSGEANGIADALEARDRAGAKGTPVHDDSIAFDAAVEVQVRAESGIKDRIVFEDDDRGLHGVERGATLGEDGPAGLESTAAAGLACIDGVVGDVPCAAMNDKRWFHGEKEWQGERGLSRRLQSRPAEEDARSENREEKQRAVLRT